jgi:hypothetical protein
MPDMWASWTPHNPPVQWIQYKWAKPVTLNQSRMLFWADHPAGSDEGVAPPAAWHLEYWSGDAWRPVANRGSYPTLIHSFAEVAFDSITTRCLRAVFNASGEGAKYAGVAVEEWQALAPLTVMPTAIRALTPEAGTPTRCAP